MLTYSVVTPARDEGANLPRLADALERQTVTPVQWLIVENGSTDDTRAIVERIISRLPWVELIVMPGTGSPVRGAPIARALNAAFERMHTDVVVNVDADVSMGSDYFERLLDAFDEDPRLGIVSGSAYELVDGQWRQRHVTGATVWGATRAYRSECLRDVLPLEERQCWDGIDEARAHAKGWTTRTILSLPFYHHRSEGHRDASGWRRWAEVGRASRYLGYRFPYLLARTIHQMRSDLKAIAIVWGYVTSLLRMEPRLDVAARRYVRSQQRLRDIPRRRREAIGRRSE